MAFAFLPRPPWCPLPLHCQVLFLMTPLVTLTRHLLLCLWTPNQHLKCPQGVTQRCTCWMNFVHFASWRNHGAIACSLTQWATFSLKPRQTLTGQAISCCQMARARAVQPLRVLGRMRAALVAGAVAARSCEYFSATHPGMDAVSTDFVRRILPELDLIALCSWRGLDMG